MADLLRLLWQDHRNFAALLDVLERQIEVFNNGGAADYNVVEGVLDYCRSYGDECHHPREDLIYVRVRAAGGDLAELSSDLQSEHEELALLTERVAEAVREVRAHGSVPRERVGAVARDFLSAYRRHMEVEEKVLFPAAVKTLTNEDWAAIEARGGQQEDPLFGAKVQKRYAALREYLYELDRIDRDG